jgi:hypothetical protein
MTNKQLREQADAHRREARRTNDTERRAALRCVANIFERVANARGRR